MKVKELVAWLRECNQDAEVSILVDEPKDDNDCANRVFAEVNEVMTTDRYCATIICTERFRNF